MNAPSKSYSTNPLENSHRESAHRTIYGSLNFERSSSGQGPFEPFINLKPDTDRAAKMAFYIFSFYGKSKLVEAKTRDEAREKLKLTHKDALNYLSLATKQEVKLWQTTIT